jgi:DNA-binding CsgD family transcriptional regulator
VSLRSPLTRAGEAARRRTLDWFVSTRAIDEEDRRREFALNGLLTGSLALALIAALQRLPAVLAGGAGAADHGPTLILASLAAIAFGLLLVASHTRGQVLAARGLLVTYYGAAVWLFVAEGTEEPMAMLLTAMLVVAAGVLLGTRTCVIAVLVATLTLVTMSVLASADALKPGGVTPGVFDQLQLCAGLAAIALVLSARTRERRGSVGELLSGDNGGPPALDDARLQALTVRELQVVRLLAAGHPNAEIARQLFVSPRTVHTHVSNALRKTNCSNRTELAVLTVHDRTASPMEHDSSS